jgi:hypothetical protein
MTKKVAAFLTASDVKVWYDDASEYAPGTPSHVCLQGADREMVEIVATELPELTTILQGLVDSPRYLEAVRESVRLATWIYANHPACTCAELRPQQGRCGHCWAKSVIDKHPTI